MYNLPINYDIARDSAGGRGTALLAGRPLVRLGFFID